MNRFQSVVGALVGCFVLGIPIEQGVAQEELEGAVERKSHDAKVLKMGTPVEIDEDLKSSLC